MLRQTAQFFKKTTVFPCIACEIKLSNTDHADDVLVWETPKNLNNLIPVIQSKGIAGGIMCRRVDDDHRLILYSQNFA